MTSAARRLEPAIAPEDFTFLQGFILKRSGIVLSDKKIYLAETRLTAVVYRHKLESLAALVAQLKAEPDGPLSAEVMDAFTTNETSFFRDRHPFTLLSESLIPSLIDARQHRKRLSLWSAASSTGQEAYSLAMLMKSQFPELETWDVSILGTDISEQALQFAREGLYRDLHLRRGLSEEQKQAFFTAEGNQWRVLEGLRRLTRFQPLNLCYDSYPTRRFDIIMLRNVLIYFDVPTQQSVLRKLHPCLARDGVLFLGGAEAALQPPQDLYMTHIDGRTIWHSPKPSGA